jgi:hypothetical protein
MAFVTTRVTNPENRAAKKAAWRKATMTKRARKHTSKKGVSRPRRTNPIDWKETAIQGGGVVAGSSLGWAVTSFVGNNLIERLPATMRGVGYLGAGFGALVAGYALRPHAPKLPILAFTFAATVPIWLRAFATFNLLPMGMPSAVQQNVLEAAPQVSSTNQGLRRLVPQRQRLLTARGTMAPGNSPGLRMNGTMLPGVSPGTRRPMAGTIL